MKKLSVIGHASAREELMKALMQLGVVEISEQETKLSDDQWKELVSQDGNDGAVSNYESQIAKVSQALEAISKYGTAEKQLFRTRKPVDQKTFEKVMDRIDEIEKKAEEVLSLSVKLSEIAASENKTEACRLTLLPWKSYDVPLEIQGTKETEVIIGTVPAAADVEQLKKDISEKQTDVCLT